MKKIISNIAMCGAALVLAAGCNQADKFDYNKEVFLITGTESTPMNSVAIGSKAEDFPVPVDITVTSTGLVANDVTVSIGYDAAALEKYNAEHNTSYLAVPEEALSFSASEVTIKAGSAVSNPLVVNLLNANFIEEGAIYMIPVGIKGVAGSNNEVLKFSQSVFYKLKRTINFWALNVDNSNLSCNYDFAETLDLPTWTFQIKCYPEHLKKEGAEQLCRLCAWKTDGNQCMLRFNENGKPWKSLQIVAPGGGSYVTGKLFEPKEWYMLTMTYDGTNFRMYINGVEDKDAYEAKGLSDMATKFSRFELGMAYAGYNSGQLFSGRISEARVWDRPISVTEMNETYCGVAKNANGLKVCWRFNEGSGYVFHNHQGNTAFDMDMKKASYEYNDNVFTPVDKSAVAAASWIKDDINMCAE